MVPTQGYRHDLYRDEETNATVPVLMASASNEHLFETFMEMLDLLGSTVDVVLETSHDSNSTGHVDLYREHIDMPVLKSILWDFEELLLNDGCTGLAVLNPRLQQEVQFDEHKLIIVYGQNLEPFEGALIEHDVPCRDDMRFITEAEHVHSSSERYREQFQDLRMQLGMDSLGCEQDFDFAQ